jgi:hypothetical protein
MNTPAHRTDAAMSACVRGVLALELAPGTAIANPALAQADAARLAALVCRDLAALAPAARALDACLMAAHFDPAEALRPGWPLHRRLDRSPGRGDIQGPRSNRPRH